ncbi:MAG TPA: Fe-S cluster assembly protein SufD [Myxococcota bacterium]|nr:Fe-S cluster assembly protein SufD [Myxococcota bacterium]
MSELSAERRWAEAFAAAASERAGEPAWLEAARKAALARFAELGVPTRRHEEWKYTSAERIGRVAWRPAPAAPPAADALAALELPLADLPRLVFVNGRFAPDLTQVEGLPVGVVASDARALWAHEGAWLEPLLALPSALAERAFAALAAAMAPDAAVVRVGRGVEAGPLAVLFLSAPGEDAAVWPRLVVEAEAGARLSLLEIHAGPAGGERQLRNALTQVTVGADAAVDHARLQLDGAGATHLGHVHAGVARDGRYASRTVALGAAVSRLELVVTLDGEGAEATLDGLYVAAGGQHSDNRTTVDHARPHGSSRELYKGVLSGRSRGVFSGKVIVRKDAQKTNAQQHNANLLLTGEAEVDSKPQLEIEADDVRCSHGSTIGQLEEDALFYLRSRGLDAGAARALLVRGFVGEIVEAIPDETLRERLLARVLVRLAGAGVRAEAAS